MPNYFSASFGGRGAVAYDSVLLINKLLEKRFLAHFSGQIDYLRMSIVESMVGLLNNKVFPSLISMNNFLQRMFIARYSRCPNGSAYVHSYSIKL
jgi:hypothetical protein